MKKIVSLFVAFSMLLFLFGGAMGSAPVAKAGQMPTSEQVINAVNSAIAKHIQTVFKFKGENGRLKELSKNFKFPYKTIDGVKIPKDVIQQKHITSADDFIQIAIDCPSEPLIDYAKKHHISLKEAANEQLSKMKATHEELKNKLLSIGVDLKDVHDMYVAYNGIAANVRIRDIENMYKNFGNDKDVARIYNNNFKKSYIHIERLYKPVDDYSNDLIGAGSTGVWSDPGVDGTGMYVGVVDTGIDYTHPDFGGYAGITFPTTKVPAGYDFGDNDPDPMDCQGHGTHVSGIIAADGLVHGVAPQAKIIIAKIVQGCGGSASSITIAEAFDYMADPNNVDGGPEGTHPPVAAVNMSFGADYGFVDPTAPDQKAIENCIASGIPVALAAGNAGTAMYHLLGIDASFYPDSASIGSPAVTPNCMAVAASWNSNATYPALTELSSGSKYAYTVGSSSEDPITTLGDNGGAGYQYVYCGLGGSPSDFPASVSGKIALIARGNYYFSTKIHNAAEAGAIGVIIFNYSDSLITMNTGSETLPAVFVTSSAGQALLSKSLNAGDGTGRVAFYSNTYTVIPEPTDQITDFSSWGPPPDLSFKPDITAPGGGIFSTIPVAMGSYASWSGTSMASPHIAACMALVKEAHPNYTPDQIKTLLMNTSKILVDPSTGTPYSPHQMGAGRVDIFNALHTDASVVDSSNGKPYVDLGEVPNYKSNPITFTVKVTNSGSSAITYDIDANVQTVYTSWSTWKTHSAPEAATITTNPSGTVTVNAGSSVDVTVTVDATGVPDWYGWPYVEGFVSFTPQGATVDAGGVPAGQIHIPYMGILGRWNDFNEEDWQFNPLMDLPADDPYSFLSWLFGYPVTWPEYTDGNTWNICGITFNGNLDRNAIAFNPNKYYLEADVGALRNMQKLDLTINNPSGSLVKQIDSIYELTKNPDPSWYPGYWYWLDPYTGQPFWWNGSQENGAGAPDGKYYLTLTATAPKIFNKSSFDAPQVIKFPVSVDRVPPQVSLKLKKNAPGDYTLDWTVSDHSPSSGIWGFALIVDNNITNPILLPPDTRTYHVNGLGSGTHTFLLLPIDNAHNIGYGHPPVVKVEQKVVSKPAGSIVSMPFTASDPDGDTISISVHASPIPKGTYKIDGSTVHYKPAPDDVGKTFTFTVVATDPAGYSGSDSFKVTVIKPQDTTPPTLQLPNVKFNTEELLNYGTFTLSIMANDNSGVIARTVVKDNGILMKDVYGPLTSLNVPLFEGVNTICVIVYDAAGNMTKKTFTLLSDTKPPVVKLNSVPASTTSNVLDLTGMAFDTTTEVKELYINGQKVPVTTSGKFNVKLKLKGGTNTITVKAIDKVGNVYTRTFKVDYIPRKVSSTVLMLQIGSPYISVNGISKKIDTEGSKPIIQNNRTLLPVRTLIESLGGTIQWNPKTRQVSIELNGNSIILTIGKSTAVVNGIKTPIDPKNPRVTPEIINGRTYLPLRFIAENLGIVVNWDSATKTISLYYMP